MNQVSQYPESPLRVLTIAPSASYPPMIGDSKRIHRLARGFLRNGVSNVCVGKDFVYRSDDDVTHPASQVTQEWPRVATGLMACVCGGHYQETKHCTRRWSRFVSSYLNDTQYNAVYCHLLFTYPSIAHLLRDRPLVIDTHNSEWEWFEAFRKSTRNPLVKRVCTNSMRRATQVIKILPKGTLMAHVSESDLRVYEKLRPDLTHIVVPNGGDVEPRRTTPDYKVYKKRLVFFASLHGKMSLDALNHFATSFWTAVRGDVEVVIAGANPSTAVRNLCAKHNWELRENLSDAKVTRLFDEAHFSILPFAYGAGSKLKFFDACMRGVPVLSTTSGACGQESLPDFVIVSDDPQEWRNAIRSQSALPQDWEEQVSRFGALFNWTAIAARIIRPMEQRLREASSFTNCIVSR